MKAKGEEGESLKKRESGERVLVLRKFYVLGEKGKERREEKKIEKRNRGKSEGDGGFERFYGCRGSSFLFVLLKGKALISGSRTWTFATLVTSFLPCHLQRMHR